MAFAAPVAGGPPLVIDQSSSATAFVNIRAAAKAGKPIPEGWALDAEGQPTTDARQAVKGALLAFGGERGANIALMVEVLAAGVSGANWSLDAPSFTSGSQSPGSGLTVIALAPRLVDPGFEIRLAAQLDRLSGQGSIFPAARKALPEPRRRPRAYPSRALSTNGSPPGIVDWLPPASAYGGERRRPHLYVGSQCETPKPGQACPDGQDPMILAVR